MAHRVLDLLEANPEYYAAMRNALAERLARRDTRDLRRARDLPYAVVQQESIVDFKFRPGPAGPQTIDDARARRPTARTRAYYRAMLERGVLLAALAERGDVRIDRARADRDVDDDSGRVIARLSFCGTSHDSKAKS